MYAWGGVNQTSVGYERQSGSSKGLSSLINQDAVNNLVFGKGKCAGMVCPGGTPVETKYGCACKPNNNSAP